jgi:hypothetical protein
MLGWLFDTTATLEDRRGDGCCTHTIDGSYRRLIVRSERRVTYLKFHVRVMVKELLTVDKWDGLLFKY